MANESKPLVLITGGTGHQGGATVEQLLAAGKLRVRVLTRDPAAPKAQALAARGVEIAKGTFDDAASLKAALDGASGAFSVQGFSDGGAEGEERRGKAFADAAKAAGLAHLVYTSVEGADRATGIPHFESKWHIEQHIRALGIPATILRPVAFMENFGDGGTGMRIFLGMLRAVMGNAKRLQLVSTVDIGWFAARALENPGAFIGRTLGLAGDELSVSEIVETYRRVLQRAPSPFPVPRFLLRLMPKEMSRMLVWFGEHGYQADIAAVRREHSELLTLEAWLRRASL